MVWIRPKRDSVEIKPKSGRGKIDVDHNSQKKGSAGKGQPKIASGEAQDKKQYALVWKDGHDY